jgi:hypothetical protein
MSVFKPKVRETIEDRLQRAINLGREEALKEVLKWLDSNTYDSLDEDFPVQADFSLKNDMFQAFKEQFNIE